MNTAFARRAHARLLLPARPVGQRAGSSRRHDDIWGGYVVKKLMDRRGHLFTFGRPIVEHTRQSKIERVVVLEHWMHLMSTGFYTLVDAAADRRRRSVRPRCSPTSPRSTARRRPALLYRCTTARSSSSSATRCNAGRTASTPRRCMPAAVLAAQQDSRPGPGSRPARAVARRRRLVAVAPPATQARRRRGARRGPRTEARSRVSASARSGSCGDSGSRHSS